MTRVFIVDDHEIVRRGITQFINSEPGLEVIGESATARGTLARVAATRPDIAVLDVRLPDGNGIELCRRIRSAHPETQCLMLTAYDDDAASTAAVLAGASGYVLKNIQGRHLIESVLRVSQGENLISRDHGRRVHSSLIAQAQAREKAPAAQAPQLNLTLRESQVLKLITEGLSNRQIAQRLNLAEKTVKNYVSMLLTKLGMDRRTQIAVYGATRAASRSTP
jgi:two-component system, NarL family, response regulator DevR